mgnify:CR=1 FL=1
MAFNTLALFSIGRNVESQYGYGRLHPVSGPGVDENHRYLFKREEIELLRPSNRLTAPELAKTLGLSCSQLQEWIKRGKVRPMSGPGIDEMKHYLFVRTCI